MNMLISLAVEKYNLVHISILAFFPILIVSSYFIFRNKSQKAKDIYMYVLMAITFVLAWSGYFYKVIFNVDNASKNFLVQLPFHLCSINAILYPLFFVFRNKMNNLFKTTTFAFMYFVGMLGAFLAMALDAPVTVMGPDRSLLDYTVFEYWAKHGLIFSIPILLIILGYYKPKYIDIIKCSVLFLILIVIAHILNVTFTTINHSMGGEKVANFFYTIHPDNMIGLKQVFDVIEIPLVYLFPFIFVAIPLFSILYIPFGIINLVKRKQKKQNNNL